jgi:hypothetical protein
MSWEELIERARASRARHEEVVWDRESRPIARAWHAVKAHDVDALTAIIDQHPELLTPSVIDREWRATLASLVLSVERESSAPEARRITDLVAARGVDMQRELDERLLGWPQDRWRPENLRWYLERGANPDWMPPNGITVLEHAIVRYRNGECVDLIAERVTPRRALWIAAGLGDAAGVRSFIAGKGKLTPEGRLHRPDHMAMGSFVGLPPNREADDLEIMWEAFQIAGWNERWAAMDALLEAGLPVDPAPMGDSEAARRILELCGAGTPEEILAERDAERPSPPPPEERTTRALQLAADDAARQAQSELTTENLLVGFLRVENGVFASFFMGTGADMRKLRALIGARLLPDKDPLIGQDLPADAVAEAALREATAEAEAHRYESVHPVFLLARILNQQNGPGARLLAEIGISEAKAREFLKDL